MAITKMIETVVRKPRNKNCNYNFCLITKIFKNIYMTSKIIIFLKQVSFNFFLFSLSSYKSSVIYEVMKTKHFKTCTYITTFYILLATRPGFARVQCLYESRFIYITLEISWMTRIF